MLGKDEIIIVDDVISPQFQEIIHKWLLAGDSGWFFSKDVAFPDNVIEKLDLPSKYAFSKTFLSVATGQQSELFHTIFPLLLEACGKINMHVDQVLFSRSFFTMPFPGSGPNDYDHIHVDTADNHTVCLYYVNDSDGDTILFDKRLEDFLEDPFIREKIESVDYSQPGVPTLFEIIDQYVDKSTFKEIRRITPKKGRMVFFDGHRYHSAARPSSGYRLIINNCVKGHFTK